MKTFIKVLNLLILIILMNGCKKETDCGDQTTITNFYYISNEFKSKIPYSGNDTIIYTSDANDTAILICSEKKYILTNIFKVLAQMIVKEKLLQNMKI